MGTVFLGVSPGYRLVAVKVIRPGYAGDPEFAARFRHEVAIARRVTGPFTAPIIGAETGEPPLWLAALYVPAPTLAETVAAAGPLPGPALHALGAGLAEAVGSLHAAGVLHRDLKPANVLLASEGPRLTDFAISGALEGTRPTRAGTLGFMSPEHVAPGCEPGPASDVFSLGALLAFAGTGRAPFGGGGAGMMLHRIVHEPADLTGLPQTISALIGACLDKAPARRPRPAELLAALAPADPRALDTPYLAAEAARRGQEAAQLIAAAQDGAPAFQERVPAALPGSPGLSGSTIAVQTQPAQGSRDWAPEGQSRDPQAGRRLSRRRLLTLGGAAAVMAAGGVTALTGLPGRSGSAVAVTRLPREPAWTVAPDWQPSLQSLVAAGGVVIWSDPAVAVALSAADGRQAWAYGYGSRSLGAVVPPGAAFHGWLGVTGSILYGRATSATGRTVVFGVAASGRRVVEHALPWLASSVTLAAVSGSRLLMVDPDAGRLLAFDRAAGQLAWSRSLRAMGQDPPVAVAADAARCYLQDAATTYGLDLTSGAVQWATPDTVPAPGIYASVTLVSGTLVVSGYGLTGLDPATGRKLWTAADEWRPALLNDAQGVDGPCFSAISAVGSQAVFADPAARVWSVDTSSGAATWKYQAEKSPGLAYPSPNVLQGTCASASLVAVASGAGFLAVEAAAGTPLGTYGEAQASVYGNSLVTVSGRDVFLVTDPANAAGARRTIRGYKGEA